MRLADFPNPIVKYVIGLWRRRWLIVALAWGLALVGWTLLRFIPDVYESRAQLYFNTDTPIGETTSDVGTALDYDQRIAALRLQLLSRENLEKVIRETGIDEGISGEAQMQKKVQSLQRLIKILSPERSFFNISYADRDPVVAQRIVDSLVNLFIEQDLASKLLDYETGLNNIDLLIAEAKQKITDKNREIAKFQEMNAEVLAGAARSNRVLEQKENELSRLQFELSTAIQRRNSLVEQLSKTPRFSSGSELDKLKLELAQLRSVYNDNYPDIQRLQARIAELENNGSALPENPEFARLSLAKQTADGDIGTLRARITHVQGEIDKLSIAATRVPEVMAQLDDIMIGKDQLEKDYQKLLERRSRLDNSSRMGALGGSVKYEIYENPTIPALPAGPPRALLSIAIALLSIGGAIGLAFLMAQLDGTYTQAEDLEEAFGLPVLGQLSPSETTMVRQKLWLGRSALVASLTLMMGLAGMMFLIYSHSPIAKKVGPVNMVLEKLLLSDNRVTTGNGGRS